MTHSISLAIAPEFVSLGSIRRCAVIMAMAMVATLAQLGAALAVDYYWDANGAGAGIGGTGTWDTSSSLWRTPTDVGALTTWPTSGTANDAIFGGVAGTVTINAVTVHNIAINDVDGYTLSGINNLTFNGTTPTITVNQAATLSAPALDGTLLFAGRLAGAGTLTVGSTNNQRWLLNTGTNTNSGYTGDMIINSGGILEPRDTLSAATGNSVTVNAGGIFQIVFSNTSINSLNGTGTVRGNGFDGGSRTLTVGKDGGSGLFSGTFQNNGTTLGLTKTGGGTQELSGTGITYTGTTSVAGGVLKLTDATAFNSNVTMNGGTLQLNGTVGTWTFGKAISNGTSGGVLKTGAGTVVLTAVNNYSGATTVDTGVLYGTGGGGNGAVITPFGTGSISISAGATLTVDNSSATGFNLFNNSAISGAGNITFIGNTANRLIANSANFTGLTGTITVDGNYVQLDGANTTAALHISSGAQLRSWSLSGSPTFGALSGNGIIQAVPGGGGNTVTIGNGGADGAFSGVIQNGPFVMSLTKAGAGTQELSGTGITYTGTTSVAGGVLKLTDATAFNSNVTMNGGTLQLNGTAGTWTFGKIISNGAGGGVVKTGGGTVVLNQANSYIGGTTISNGTLYLDAGSAGSGLITLSDANTGASNVQLDIRNSGLGNAITVANQGTGTATIRIVNPAGGFTQSLGSVTLNRATTLSAPNLTSFLQFNGAFAGNGALTIGTTNNQRLILVASAASYSGDLTVQNSAIFEPRDMLSSATGNSATLDSGGILQIVFSDTSINALNGAGTVRSNSFDGGGTRTLTLGKDNGNGAFSGTIIDNGHALALAKTGTGTQTLSSASTYSGGTTINGGTLKITNVAGSATGSGLVTVNVNGTLSGVGSIVGGPVNLFGAVSPGNSVGTLFADSFNWQGGGTYQWEITSFTGTPGADWDLLNLTDGTLTFVGTGPFNLAIDASTVGIVPVGDYLFEIARADNISNFAVANFMLTATGPGNGTSNTNWSILRQGNRIFLQATVTPEPSTWVMFAIAGVLCAIGSRFATTRDRK